MRAAVVGLGYVGLVTASCLAERDHDVIGIEVDEDRIRSLMQGITPFHEPGLADLVTSGIRSGRLRFATEAATAVAASQVVILAVGTHDGHGGWQTDTIRATLAQVVPNMPDDATLVVRSTLPPEFLRQMPRIVDQIRAESNRPQIPVMLNPEFTREGQAVRDFLEPDRIVIGVGSDPTGRGVATLQKLYKGFVAPVLVMSALDACLSKLGANLFLATKISFANELAQLCDAYGADVTQVTRGMSYDPRIGGSFLRAGIGFGGSCLPHQVTMTVKGARAIGLETPLLAAVDDVNARQRQLFVDRMRSLLGNLDGARIALLGLAFKPDTDDLREAPAIDIARALIAEGATVVAYDPMWRAMEGASRRVPGLELAPSARDAMTGADAVGLVTEWTEFREIDWTEARSLVRRAILVDGRNALDPAAVVAADFAYASFGRDVAARSGESVAGRTEAAPVARPIGVPALAE